MANNNDQLFDAALCAFVAGSLNASISDSVQADYASIVNAGVVFAAAVDALIPTDASIVTPVTKYTLSHVTALSLITHSVMLGRFPVGAAALVSANYAINAAAIAAAYKQTAASLA